MDLNDAKSLALSLINLHIPGWSFGFDNASSKFGRCFFKTKHISLSGPLTTLNSEHDVRDTILHEIAHALAGHAAGHGLLWRHQARRLGASDKRCFGEHIVKPQGSFMAMCPNCSKIYRRTRPPKRVRSCGACNPVFDERFKLNFVKLEEK